MRTHRDIVPRRRSLGLVMVGVMLASCSLALADDNAPAATSDALKPAQQTPKPVDAGGDLNDEQLKKLPKDLSPEQEAKLKEHILKRISEEAKKAPPATAKPTPPQATARPATPVRPHSPQAVRPAQRQSGAKEQEAGGCAKGSNTGPLQPPPPDQPQPKLVCEETEIERSDVWKGEMSDFTFKIRNAGEGPLQIQVKGG